MQQAIDGFRANIERVNALGDISRAIDRQTTVVIDLTDLLRAQMVLSVSALDYYIHEVVRIGMMESYLGTRTRTDQFRNWNLKIADVEASILNPQTLDWLDEAVRREHGWRSFQSSENVAKAVRLIHPDPIWAAVAAQMGRSAADIRRQMDLVVDRRNKIAHEADMDPSYPGTRWPISSVVVEDATNFISGVVEAIHTVVC